MKTQCPKCNTEIKVKGCSEGNAVFYAVISFIIGIAAGLFFATRLFETLFDHFA